MTDCSQTSFDSRLSDLKKPSGSENSVDNLQNSASESRSGSARAASTETGAVWAAAAGGVGAGCVAGAACLAQEAGVRPRNSRSEAGVRNRFNTVDPARRILTESRRTVLKGA